LASLPFAHPIPESQRRNPVEFFNSLLEHIEANSGEDEIHCSAAMLMDRSLPNATLTAHNLLLRYAKMVAAKGAEKGLVKGLTLAEACINVASHSRGGELCREGNLHLPMGIQPQ